jgi:hypothetical protein
LALGQELSPKEAINFLDAALQGVKSFDVELKVTWKQFIVEERRTVGNDGKPIVNVQEGKKGILTRLRRIGPNERPSVRQVYSHQLFENGRGRVEVFEKPGTTPSVYFVYDRETQRSLNPAARDATIDRASFGPPHMIGEDYREAYYSVFGRAGIVEILGQRSRLVKITPGKDGLLTLEAPPDPKGNTHLPDSGIRVTIDPAHGFMPSEIEVFRSVENRDCTTSRRQVTRWKSLDGGIWVPVELVTKHYSCDPAWKDVFGTVGSEGTMIVDESRARWNQAIPEVTFQLPFPSGTEVVDYRREVKYTTGKPDLSANLEDLAGEAKELVPIHTVHPPEQSHLRIVLVASALFLLATVGVILVARMVSRRRNVAR